MKTKVAIISATTIFLGLLFILAPYVQNKLIQGELTNSLSDLRLLYLTIQQYHLDSAKIGSDSIYPNSLEDLTKNNEYMSKNNLDSIKRSLSVRYFHPAASPHSEDIILTAHTKKYCISYTISGAAHIDKE